MPNQYPINLTIEKLKEMEHCLSNSILHFSTNEKHLLINQMDLDWVREEIRRRDA